MTTKPEGAAEQGRFEELEAYRGVAALGIVLFHAYQHSRVGATYVYEGTPAHLLLRNLEAGVAWFFALSGFLIFLPFARAAVEQRRPQSARGFLVRRVIRIIPLYYLAILVVWVLRYTGGPEQWYDLLLHLSFTQVFDQVHIFWTIGPAWSLAVEMLFYLLITLAGPWFYGVCGRIVTPGGRLAWLTAACLALVGGSLVYKGLAFYVLQIPEDNWPVYFSLPAKLDTFALGMLLAVAVVASRGRPQFAAPVPALLRIIGALLLAVTFGLREISPPVWLYFHTLAGVGATLFLASTVLGPRGSPWERMLSWPALQFLGVVSYSLYIWHEPILIALADSNLLIFENPVTFPFVTLVLLGAVLAVAYASYWALEYPALLLRFLFTREGRLADRYPE
ncbi:MAG TPA: acyltransferase [Chloroflexia bacterium]|nr:acyltransferase [Chloroflexia bacterium]